MAKAKEIEGLNCHAPAHSGISLVLMTRLEEMCALRGAALDWSDMEGVHDMRVASRRLRSALRDFQPFLHEKVHQRKLRDLARALGRVRDEDVAIAALEALAAEVPQEVVAGLNHIIDERRGQRELAREALGKAIGETSIVRLKEKLVLRFERATRSGDEAAAEADSNSDSLSFRSMGREIILSRLEELSGLAGSLFHPFKIEPLHRMRIAAKSLRYAMELFASCWGARLKPFAAEVAKLQEMLGGLHDSDVWIEDLGRQLKRDHEAGEEMTHERVASRAAAVWLLQHFSRERTRHYRRALAHWFELEQTRFNLQLAEALAENAEESPSTPTETSVVS